MTNFAGQWLYLRNLTNHQPNSMVFPDFDDNLRQAFRREAELFFGSIMREDRNVLDLMTADYTFVNERLARHYGIPERVRKPVPARHAHRRGAQGAARQGRDPDGDVAGHADLAGLARQVDSRQHPQRAAAATAANVPPLPESEGSGQVLSMRQRMEAHRKNPVCANCHRMFDPIGLAMENFDAVGRWRMRDGGSLGASIDASGELLDGTKVDGVVSLRRALLRQPELFVGTVTEKLMTYALGRGVAADDMPSVRAIIRDATSQNYRFSSLVLGIVRSAPFTMRSRVTPERDSRLSDTTAAR